MMATAKPCPTCLGAARIGPNMVQCSTCIGTGVAPYVPTPFAKYGTTRALCNKCGGTGRQVGTFGSSGKCATCRGTGRKLPVYETCPRCHGSGDVSNPIGELDECPACSGDGAIVNTA